MGYSLITGDASQLIMYTAAFPIRKYCRKPQVLKQVLYQHFATNCIVAGIAICHSIDIVYMMCHGGIKIELNNCL
jgi:hypothetical protein